MAFRLTSFRVALAALALTSVVSSCSDDTDDDPTPATGMSWTVDGANVTANGATATTALGDLIISGFRVASGDTSNVLLNIPPRTGTFAIDANSDAGALYNASSNGLTLEASTGSITVTSYSASTTAGASTAVGTFTFTADNGTLTKTLTNGKFNVKF